MRIVDGVSPTAWPAAHEPASEREQMAMQPQREQSPNQPPQPHDLHLLFHPRSVALIGASDRPGSLGARATENLLVQSDFHGEVFLVNRGGATIFGRPSFTGVGELPGVPDVAVVLVPAAAAIGVLQECADLGVGFAIVLTSGFAEAGEEGRLLDARLAEIVASSSMRVYGPNCPGLYNVAGRLGLTITPNFTPQLRPGPIGLITQGGGLGVTIQQAMARGIGMSLWASSGNEHDLQVADFIDYMADDPSVEVIVTLIEGIRDGRRFARAARKAAARGKPVVALKVGRSELGKTAAASHTGALTGEADVNSAVFRQLGIIEVDDVDELIDTAWLLVRGRPGAASGVAVYSGSGGANSLTADIVGQHGLELAQFAPDTAAALAAALPDYAAIDNPVDVTTVGWSQPEAVDQSLLDVCRDPNVALVLFPLVANGTNPADADAVVRVQPASPVPILPVWMSDERGDMFDLLADAGIVPALQIGKAAKAIRRWLDWQASTSDLAAHPPAPETAPARGDAAEATFVLSEPAAKSLIARAGVAVPSAHVATTAEEAAATAERIGYPVVAKVVSSDIMHKSEVGGVQVGIHDAAGVTAAWEAIHESVQRHAPAAGIDGILVERMLDEGIEVFVGVSQDPVWGPVLTFGLGGIFVEILRDVSHRMLPLTAAEAEGMIREIRGFPLLDGARGRPKADLPALRDLLLRVSELVQNEARIDQLELNPVWVGPAGSGAVALDALVFERPDLAPADTEEVSHA